MIFFFLSSGWFFGFGAAGLGLCALGADPLVIIGVWLAGYFLLVAPFLVWITDKRG